MCGIIGICDFNNKDIDKNLVREMTRLIEYRGPNGDGIYIDNHIGLGHRRLSIIDLSQNGKQPMSNEDGTIWVTFNGEIYDYQNLRDDLEKKGHRFKSDTDTETLVHAYEEYGENFIVKLRGMFAFAIWDNTKKELLIARDRTGQKPVFYYYKDKKMIFTSELKTIFCDKTVLKNVNKEAISHYLTLGYVPAPLTIFQDMYKLKPGHYLKFNKDGLTLRQYWDLDFAISNKSLDYYIKKTKEHLDEAVRIRLRSDVPLGAFLSGGIDSSAIVAYMTKNMDRPVDTFSIGFEEDEFDETSYAKIIAKKFDTNHREFIVKQEMADIIPKLVWHYNEPYADSSSIPTYFLSKMTRKYATVALNGDAGDENFAGYDRYAGDNVLKYYGKIPSIMRRPFESVVNRLKEPQKSKHPLRMTKRIIEANKQNPLDRYVMFISYFNKEIKSKLIKNHEILNFDTVKFMGKYFEKPTGLLNKKLYLDIKTYLPDDLLTKVDIASMANSLECRSPFLDHKFMEFNATIPERYKLNGFSKKYILKKALSGTIPKEILYRKKMGFGLPIGSWLRNDLRDMSELFLGKDLSKRGYFKTEKIENMLNEHRSRKKDHSQRLWNLLCLEMWHKIYIDNDPTKKNDYRSKWIN